MGLEHVAQLQWKRRYPTGQLNLITDVPGVKVGQVTLEDPDRHIHTGVTAILPHEGNLFQEKVRAGVTVVNGFGKTVGLIQVAELGQLESPILLTNTLSVGTCLTALTRYLLADNPEIGTTTGTVNAVVGECNDGVLNDIRGFHVEEADAIQALEAASQDFEEGAVGAGRGMVCFGFKGGIGSASRQVEFGETTYHLGSLVLTNYGAPGRLRLGGQTLAPPELKAPYEGDQGSCMIVIATDLPLSSRQLKRVSQRASAALGRTGSYIGHGSGDIALAFQTAHRLAHHSDQDFETGDFLREDRLDTIFEATVEAVEEAIISSLYHAEGMTGLHRRVLGLRQVLEDTAPAAASYQEGE